MIANFEKVENPRFSLKRYGQNCPLSDNEVKWLLHNRSWHLDKEGDLVHSPYFDATIARIDRINGYANKVFLEAI